MKRKTGLAILGRFFLGVLITVPIYALPLEASNSELIMSGDPLNTGIQDRVKVKPVIGMQKVSLCNLRVPIQGFATEESATHVAQVVIDTGSFHTKNGAIFATGSDLENPKSTAVVVRTRIDKKGNSHIRVAQRYKGLRVIGAEIIVHVNKENSIYHVNGKYMSDPNISATPSVEAKEALQIGLDEQQGKSEMHVIHDPELVIYGGRLAYFYIIEHEGPEVGQWYYYVDAQTGKRLSRYNNIQYADPTERDGSHVTISGCRLPGEDGTVITMQGWHDNPTGNYYMLHFDSLWAIYDEDVNDWEQQASSDWGMIDPAAVSAGKNFEIVQDFVKNMMGMNSFDDAGAFAYGVVHVGDDHINAYWNGNAKAFFFGDGDGINADPLTTLDIVAHEFGHALTQYSSNLIYEYESGALNEVYSDIMGVTVEFWSQPDDRASYPSSTPGAADWLMGEDCWLADEALRNMRDPLAYGYPAYYLGTNWYFGDNDNGGVHTNCTPLTFGFYLLSDGGIGTNDGHPYGVTGVGIERAAEIALNANLNYHTSTDEYVDARVAWIDAANDLGYDVSAVKAVFKAIGVGIFWLQQLSSVNDISYLSQNILDAALVNQSTFIADDFVCSEPWEIRTINIPGRLWAGGTETLEDAAALHFEIYGDNGGIPDGDPSGGGNAPIWSLSVSPSDSQITILNGVYDQPSDVILSLDTPANLSAGIYWLVFYPDMTVSTVGRYGRNPSDTTYGYTAQVINPNGGVGLPTTWTPVTDPATFGITQQDFAFIINYFTPLPGGIQFNSATYSVDENGGLATITVARTNGSEGAVSISYATSNGTASSSTDYNSTSGTLSWGDGDTMSQTFTVAIIDDADEESDETIILTLSSPQGSVSLGNYNTATLTITANDSSNDGDNDNGGSGGGCFITTLINN